MLTSQKCISIFVFAMVTLLSCISLSSSLGFLPRITRTDDAIIVDCKFSLFSNLNTGSVISEFSIQLLIKKSLSHIKESTCTMKLILIQKSIHFRSCRSQRLTTDGLTTTPIQVTLPVLLVHCPIGSMA